VRLAELLRAFDRAEVIVTVKGGHLAVSPRSRVNLELREEILRHRNELLRLFRDPPSWPLSRGRSGVLADPDAVFGAIGRLVKLRDGRSGTLRAAVYDTRTGRLRCRLEIAGGGHLTLDPEELVPLAGGASAVAESR
jgi:hypothetical protein